MKDLLIGGIIAATMYFIVFTSAGIMEASQKREFEIAKGCIYKSYLSLYNPAFLLTKSTKHLQFDKHYPNEQDRAVQPNELIFPIYENN